ncbi:four-helix bundle copper-binding protein [Bosea sp. 2KB_26]|uniref:four-helix bundle copper-binding protein n=1 Tax=Bosea sp. 2KB_26 TaxID=3237475 RepID=UPI003F91C2EE
MDRFAPEMQACIDECLRCYQTCLGMITNHCLRLGGAHAAPEHIQLMLTCAETCRASAQIMIIGSPHHKRLCTDCADICENCAAECKRIGNMDDCVQACRRCAERCRKMAA